MKQDDTQERSKWYLERVEYYRWEKKMSWGKAAEMAQEDLKKKFK